jgi:hypothetical protein
MRTFVTTMAAAVIVFGFTAAVQAQGNGGDAQGTSKSQIGSGMSGKMSHKMSHMRMRHHKHMMMQKNNM